jgi:hypothetical protein
MTRPAYSLVELLVVLTASTVGLGLATGLLHRGLSLQSQARCLCDEERTALRLARQFRADIHLASAIRIPSRPDEATAGPLLEIDGPHGRVSYLLREQAVIRQASAAAPGPRVEAYRCPAETAWRVEQNEQAIVLTGSVAPTPRQRPYDLHVIACVGREGLCVSPAAIRPRSLEREP